MVEGIYRLLLSSETGPVNLGNPEEIPILELAQEVIALTGSKSMIVFEPLPADDPQQRKPDICKAVATLRCHPKVNRAERIKRLIPHFKAQLEALCAQ